jgi:type IV pilus assembly protein PilW
VVPLVEGIEKFQVEYGIDTPLTGLPTGAPYAGDGMPDSYVAAPSVAQFSQVVAVRLHVLARTTEPSGGYVDTKTYNLGLHGAYEPNLVAADRPYKRHLFTTVVRLQNVAGWREK